MPELKPKQEYYENFHIPIYVKNKTKRKIKVNYKITKNGLVVELTE